jgi:hypothetical protein
MFLRKKQAGGTAAHDISQMFFDQENSFEGASSEKDETRDPRQRKQPLAIRSSVKLPIVDGSPRRRPHQQFQLADGK